MSSVIKKALSRDSVVENVFKLLIDKGYEPSFQSVEEMEAVKSFIRNSADAGYSAEQIVKGLLAPVEQSADSLGTWYAQSPSVPDVPGSDSGTDNFSNRLLPGQPEPIIPAKRKPRTTGWAQGSAVGRSAGGQATVSGQGDDKTPDSYGYSYRNPTEGRESWPTEAGRERYSDDSSIAGGSADRSLGRAPTGRTHYTGLGQLGAQQPSNITASPGSSGQYSRDTYLTTRPDASAGSKKAYQDEMSAKARSTVLTPEKLDAFRRTGKSVPARKSVLTKGIVDRMVIKSLKEEATAPSFTKLTEEEIAKIDEEDALYEEAAKLDATARKLDDEGQLGAATLLREKAVKLRSRTTKNLSAAQLLEKS